MGNSAPSAPLVPFFSAPLLAADLAARARLFFRVAASGSIVLSPPFFVGGLAAFLLGAPALVFLALAGRFNLWFGIFILLVIVLIIPKN